MNNGKWVKRNREEILSLKAQQSKEYNNPVYVIIISSLLSCFFIVDQCIGSLKTNREPISSQEFPEVLFDGLILFIVFSTLLYIIQRCIKIYLIKREVVYLNPETGDLKKESEIPLKDKLHYVESINYKWVEK